MKLSFQEATLDTDSPDREATLVFRDGKLLAVLCCLSDIHGDLAGEWFVEALFARAPKNQPIAFKDLTLFEEWIVSELR